MVAALTRIFGVHNLALAEDVVQDAFCRALEVWKVRGVPENPSAWLMATAKNRALDVVRRERTARTFAPEMAPAARDRVDARARWSTRRSPRTTIQRRAAADDVLVLSSATVRGRAGRARPQHPVRLRRARDRERVSQRPRGDREADLAGQEGARRALERLFDLADAEFAARLSAVRRALVSALQRGLSRRVRPSRRCGSSSAARRSA